MNREYPQHPLAAVGAVIKNDDQILLIKRRYEPSMSKWSIPGGLIELGERIQEALKREAEEETGLKVEVDKLIDAIDNIVTTEDNKIKFHYVLIDYLTHPVGGKLTPSNEALDIKWFKSEELEKYELTRTTKTLLKQIKFLVE